jgi:hypothetical protein
MQKGTHSTGSKSSASGIRRTLTTGIAVKNMNHAPAAKAVSEQKRAAHGLVVGQLLAV